MYKENCVKIESLKQYKETTDVLNKKLIDADHVKKKWEEEQGKYYKILKSLTEEGNELIQKEHAGKDNKMHLTELLDKVLEERKDLMNKLNLITEKYEQYVRTFSSKRNEIENNKKDRIKVLSTSLLFMNLVKQRRSLLRLGLCKVKLIADYRNESKTKLLDLVNFQETYKERLLSLAFQRWRCKTVSSIREIQINQYLINKKVVIKELTMYFSLWQSIYRFHSNKKDRQIDAAKRIHELKSIQYKKDMKRCICHWYKFTEKKIYYDLLDRKSVV